MFQLMLEISGILKVLLVYSFRKIDRNFAENLPIIIFKHLFRLIFPENVIVLLNIAHLIRCMYFIDLHNTTHFLK